MPLPGRSVRRHVPDRRPAGDVDVGVLPVGVVAKEELGVLPAVEARYFAKGGLCRGGKTFGLSVAIVCTLDVRGLDLAAMEDDSSGGINE